MCKASSVHSPHLSAASTRRNSGDPRLSNPQLYIAIPQFHLSSDHQTEAHYLCLMVGYSCTNLPIRFAAFRHHLSPHGQTSFTKEKPADRIQNHYSCSLIGAGSGTRWVLGLLRGVRVNLGPAVRVRYLFFVNLFWPLQVLKDAAATPNTARRDMTVSRSSFTSSFVFLSMSARWNEKRW